MRVLNFFTIILFSTVVWTFPSSAANVCLKGKVPSSEQFEEAEKTIISDKNFNFADGKMTETSNQISLPEDLTECSEFKYSQQKLAELEFKWRYMALKYPANLNYVFNYKLINTLYINSM